MMISLILVTLCVFVLAPALGALFALFAVWLSNRLDARLILPGDIVSAPATQIATVGLMLTAFWGFSFVVHPLIAVLVCAPVALIVFSVNVGAITFWHWYEIIDVALMRIVAALEAALKVLIFGEPGEKWSGSRSGLPCARPAPRARLSTLTGAPVLESVKEVPSESQVLAGLLEQVASLQKWILRPDADRVRVQDLVAATAGTEAALRDAVDKQTNGVVDWKGIRKHIKALKEHNLPEETSEALEKLLSERHEALEQTKAQVSDLSGQLEDKRHALAAHVNKTTAVDPDAVIASADAALKDAARASSKK